MPNRVHALEMHPLPFCSALLNLYNSIHYFYLYIQELFMFYKRSIFGGRDVRLGDGNVR